jgi:hypothetical protein
MENTIEINIKYNCDLCKYKCIYPAHWKQHIESEKHKNNGIRKPRSDKTFEPKCKSCDYITTRTTNMKLHYLNHHSNKEERKKEFKYYCEDCDFGHFTKALYKAHLEAKHLILF